MKTAIVIDLGATNLRGALVDDKGKILKKAVTKTPSDAHKVTQTIIRIIKEVARNCDVNDSKEIGISMAGPINQKEGSVLLTNVGMTRIQLAAPLKKNFQQNVFLMNDCEAAVLGEKFLSHRKSKNLLFITISTGIGGGAIKNGKLIKNKKGLAGEVGHQKMGLKYNLKCPCGGFDHWEAYGSGIAMPIFLKSWAKSKGYQIPTLDIFEIFQAAKEKDPKILEFIEKVAQIDALGIDMVAQKYKPEIIVLSGSVFLKNQTILLPLIRKYSKTKVSIVPTKLGDNSPLLGAAAYVFDNLD